jgi:hypothetical protein
MSSITPASFVDDGSSFEKRILHPSHNSKWLNSSSSDTTSAYTGSYIDDGADMLLPSRRAPGFGPINPKFYKQRKRKENENGAWNDDIQKAVAGDIGQSLEKMRGIGELEVKRPTKEKIDKHGKRKKNTVTIPLPRKWGTFVIKADDGRVIVVDEDGEFDSGPQVQQQPTKWIKAPTMISPPPSSTTERSRGHKDKKHLEPIKSLISIPESEYEDGYISLGGEDVMSPTGFFTTGGANGWPSRSASPVKSRRSSRHSLPVRIASPIRSLPGSWPSPPQSPIKSANVSEKSTSSVETWGEKKSSSSSKSKKSHRWSRKDDDVLSTKTYSTYKPATVEDASDTSSEDASLVKEGWRGSQKSNPCGWGGSRKGSEASWGGDKKDSEHNWDGSNKSSHKSSRLPTNPNTWAIEPPVDHHPAPSVIQNWVGDRVNTVSEASTHKARSHRHRSRSHSRALSEATWDGYELPKSMSDVSVAGTNSERSMPGSRRASTRRSHRSNQTDHWGGSERDWGGSQKTNVDGRRGDRTDSESGGKSRYSNGYNEDDGTYLNNSWSGVKVRVRSRRGSTNAGGWAE